MKYVWEEKDIIVGQWVTCTDFESKFTKCITWHSNRHNDSRVDKTGNVFGVCDIATDGLSKDLGNKEDVVNYLNRHNYMPIDKAQIIRTPNGPQSPRT